MSVVSELAGNSLFCWLDETLFLTCEKTVSLFWLANVRYETSFHMSKIYSKNSVSK